jgi:small-conductance mechanosensitive channel
MNNGGIPKSIDRRTKYPRLVILLSQLSYWTVVRFGLVLAFQQVGSNLTACLGGPGVAGSTIGFALQDVSAGLTIHQRKYCFNTLGARL